jgi:murein DD-endopeptidase MepM/ murein hydrolase activator NlpD
MKKKDQELTILLIRGAGRENIVVRLRYGIMKAFSVLFVVFTLSLCVFIGYYGRITEKVFFVKNLSRENQELHQKVLKIAGIYDELDRLREYEKKLKILTRNVETGQVQADSAPSGEMEQATSEKGINEFIERIKIRRNVNYLNQKDDAAKRKLIVESVPNILPLDGWISRGFEEGTEKNKKGHLGVDIAAAYDSRIKASGPGIVTFEGWKEDFGNMVEIDHGYGFVTRYGHCSRSIVHRGDLVERSQTIAFVGSSGRSSAPHLHFELLKDGKETDPMIFIYK